MATASLPRYITVAEFDRMEFDDEREYELIDGQSVEVRLPPTTTAWTSSPPLEPQRTKRGSSIPLPAEFGGGEIALDEILTIAQH